MKVLALHPEHAQLGGHFREEDGHEVVWTYGAPAAEYEAARHQVALADLSQRTLLRITGEDRISFLHGMVTNDVKGLPLHRTAPAALLTAKGAMVADARIWHREGDLLLELEPGLLPKVKQFLDGYLISEDAELWDASSELALLTLYGPKSRQVFQEAFSTEVSSLTPHEFRPFALENETAWALADEGLIAGSLKLLLPHKLLNAAWARMQAKAKPIGEEVLEVLRVESGMPRYGRDMDDKTIPLEANLQSSIHYNKGCYIGQEVIARATFRGHVNRKLSGLLLGELDPAPKTELYKGEKKVGWLTSVVFSYALRQRIALGYVHRDFLEPGTELSLAQGAKATVHPLPFVSRG